MCTDAGWGPQDASQPRENDDRIVTIDECKSLLGNISIRMGGPLDWSTIREKRPSRSTCEAEIKSVDEGCKKVETIHNLHSDLSILLSSPSPIFKPTHLLNDNQGSVDWSHGHGTKKMKHINIHEMCVRAAREQGDIAMSHIPGILNPADLMTKEHQDVRHFTALRDLILVPRIRGGCLPAT